MTRNKSRSTSHTGRETLRYLDELHKLDYSFKSGRILGSMCTQPHPLAVKAYMKFLSTNLGDPELFPGAMKMEAGLIGFISSLLHAPESSSGLVVSGGTEGNITSMWIAKKLTNKKEIIVPESAHFSFRKVASLMDMKLVDAPLNKDYTVDVSKVKKMINSRTAAVIGVAGSTTLGTVDNIEELSKICYDEDIFLHVDAAFGGYVIPFMKQLGYKVRDFDFSLKGVSTISVDAHKMGCSVIPLGMLIVRDKRWIDLISVDSPYISIKRQAGILGTRSGGPVAAAYALTRYLGVKGYTRIVKQCLDNTKYMEGLITSIGLRLVTKPTMNVLGVRLNKLSTITDMLSREGWRVNKIESLSCIRIVVMPHVTRKVIDEFIPMLRRICSEVGEI